MENNNLAALRKAGVAVGSSPGPGGAPGPPLNGAVLPGKSETASIPYTIYVIMH